MTTKDKLIFFSKHGVSVAYIAKRMGLNPTTLTKWLNNQKGITHKNEKLLDSTLKLIVEEFLLIME